MDKQNLIDELECEIEEDYGRKYYIRNGKPIKMVSEYSVSRYYYLNDSRGVFITFSACYGHGEVKQYHIGAQEHTKESFEAYFGIKL